MTDPIRILLVDDNSDWRKFLRLIFERDATMELVGEASAGEDVFDLIEQLQPDALIIDVRLPTISGLEVLQQLHDRGVLPRLPTLLLSGESDVTDEQIMAVGAWGFVSKRNSPAGLPSTIREMVAEPSEQRSDPDWRPHRR